MRPHVGDFGEPDTVETRCDTAEQMVSRQLVQGIKAPDRQAGAGNPAG